MNALYVLQIIGSASDFYIVFKLDVFEHHRQIHTVNFCPFSFFFNTNIRFCLLFLVNWMGGRSASVLCLVGFAVFWIQGKLCHEL